MRLALMAAAALGATACVGDQAELGGVTNRIELPTNVAACDMNQLQVVQKGRYVFPGDALAFYYAAGRNMPLSTMTVSYDITPQGEPVNIRYTGASEDTRHATKQKLIRAAVDGVKSTRYAWTGAPSFAVGCSYAMDVMIRIHRDPI